MLHQKGNAMEFSEDRAKWNAWLLLTTNVWKMAWHEILIKNGFYGIYDMYCKFQHIFWWHFITIDLYFSHGCNVFPKFHSSHFWMISPFIIYCMAVPGLPYLLLFFATLLRVPQVKPITWDYAHPSIHFHTKWVWSMGQGHCVSQDAGHIWSENAENKWLVAYDTTEHYYPLNLHP